MTYASRTKVPVEKTRMEIERLVMKRGAKGFATAWQGTNARVEFLLADRRIRLTVSTPDIKMSMQHWRALLLLVKAKFAAMDAKIVTLEQAFVGDIVMPDGRTVYETVREPMQVAYRENKNVTLLEAPRQ